MRFMIKTFGLLYQLTRFYRIFFCAIDKKIKYKNYQYKSYETVHVISAAKDFTFN